jgi:hypothetical protein
MSCAAQTTVRKPKPDEVEEQESQVQQMRNSLPAILLQLGLYRLESKGGRAGVGQCLYTLFGGSIDGLRLWRNYCERAVSKVPEGESKEFWLTAREHGDYGLARLKSWVREDRAAELLGQMAPKRCAEKESRLAVGQVLYNAFDGQSAGRTLWLKYCRDGKLSKEELEAAEKFWEEAKESKDPPRLLKEWAVADQGATC